MVIYSKEGIYFSLGCSCLGYSGAVLWLKGGCDAGPIAPLLCLKKSANDSFSSSPSWPCLCWLANSCEKL